MENYVEQSPVNQVFEDQISKSKFYTQIFLYFGLGILITALTSLIVSWAFSSIWTISKIIDGVIYIEESTFSIYLGIIIASSIALFILSLVITFKTLKGSGSLVVPYVLYSLLMGVLLSSIGFFVGNQYIIGEALFITALIFLGMCGVGYLTHNKLATWARILVGVSICLILLCLLNFVLLPFVLFGGNYAAFEANMWIYFVTEIVIIGFFALVTAFDMARIRTIAERGMGSKNIALYCALNLYSDFIALFIYILRILIVIASSSRK